MPILMDALVRLRQASTGVTIGNLIQLKKNKRRYMQVYSRIEAAAETLEQVKMLDYKEEQA
jgi:hypothetical protein